MSPANPNEKESSGRPFDAALDEYMQIEETGGVFDADQFLEKHANSAADLRDYLRGKLYVEQFGQQAFDGCECKPGLLREHFGRYRIVKKLGEHGMGAVYLADDIKLDRQVALKIPRFTTTDDPEIFVRFEREARAAANLDHANICPILDVGEIDGIHFLSMRYIEGRPLSALANSDTRLSERDTAALVLTLARALQYAHDQGVIHRDLKPSNVMVRDGVDGGLGEPVIIDFGLASRLGKNDPRVTTTGAILGTPAYMAPECIQGTAQENDKRCDIYGLGTILYQMLTSRLPFEGSTAEVLTKILREEPPKPSSHRPDLDPRLEAICQKAMAKTPTDRYATMGEMADDLDACLQSYGDEASPNGNVIPTKMSQRLPETVAFAARHGRFSCRRAPVWIIGCLALLLLFGTLAWTVWLRSRDDTSETAAAALRPIALYWAGFAQAHRNGQLVQLELKDGTTLFSGEQYRLELRPSHDCYLYVIAVDSHEGPVLWFPHEEIQLSNRCLANRPIVVPDGDNWYTLDDRTGPVTVYLLASYERLFELEHLLSASKRSGTRAATNELASLVQALANSSARELRTRGQSIEPDLRLAKVRIDSGEEIQQKMEFQLGAGCVVRQIRFEHQAPPTRE